ncbi:MAG: translation initiation factor IF-2 [Coriobacteriia bacterium]
MPAMRVHELAKEFGMTSKELLDRLQEMKIPAKNHASTLVDAYVDKIRKALGPEIAERQAQMEAERIRRETAETAKREADEKALRLAEEERKAAELAARTAEDEERERQEAKEAARRAEEAAKREAEEAARQEAEGEARKAADIAKAEATRIEQEEAERYRRMALEAEQAIKQAAPTILAEAAKIAAQAATGGPSKRKTGKKPSGRREAAVAGVATGTETPAHDAPVATGESLTLTEGTTVGEFAAAVSLAPGEIIKRLMLLGEPLTVNQPMSRETIEILAEDLGWTVKVVTPEEEITGVIEDHPDDLVSRPPVVTVMGHVDHGKTSLLDAIRSTGVAATEAGGITQHIGASVVRKNGKQITFIDTPGHEAFTAMRARGAKVTDVAVLVVAADDGVMPQTVEAIDHAKAAGVPILVAVNKIDKDGANPDRVRQELSDHGVIPEEWGGSNVFVDVSAKKHLNIDELLEMILLVADVQELKANPDAPASGVVIEAKLDRGRGPVATVLVQRGTLKVGDAVVAGLAHGRVRALVDPKGDTVVGAAPADPVEIVGLAALPSAGDEFRVVADERTARQIAEERALKQRLVAHQRKSHVSLDDLFARIQEGQIKDLNLVVKADVQGSIEALSDAFEKIDQSEVRINMLHSGVGGITETDIMLADASDAIVIGFNVRPEPKAKVLADQTKVDMRLYRVIYQAIEDITAARVGMLAPKFEEHDASRVDVRELFRIPKVGVIAGCVVQEGEVSRDDQVRVVRQGAIVFDGKLHSLRRFKEDVKSVKAGYECGIGIEGFQDIKEGDVIETYRTVEVARTE